VQVEVGIATTTVPRTARVTRARAGACTVEIVSDADAFGRLEAEWNDAVERAGVAHPFLRHEWMWTWWQCFGDGRELRLVIVRSGGRIIGIAPLLLETTSIGRVPVRQLRLLFNDHTPRTEFILCEPGERVYRAIWHALADLRDRWDVLLLGQLPRESSTRQMAARLAAESGEAVGVWRSSDSPYLSLAGTWDSYFGGLSGKFRSNVRNRTTRLQRLGGVELESVDDPSAIETALDDTFRLEASGWKQMAGTAINSDAAVHRFYTLFAGKATARGWLRLQFLSVGGLRIAASYSLVHANRLFLCKTGYDPAFETGSPFKVLTSLATQKAYAEGLEEVDFLGDTEPWKREWTPTVRSHDWLYIFSHTLRAKLAHALKFRVGPALRSTRHPAPTPGTDICTSPFIKV
jgi:CelD/BcsL family acetyltransferase involved in cellulose biosynthesis